MRLYRSFGFNLVLWFVLRFPRTSKALLILGAAALLFGMVYTAVSK